MLHWFSYLSQALRPKISNSMPVKGDGVNLSLDRMLYCLINVSLWISWTYGFETTKVIRFVVYNMFINRARLVGSTISRASILCNCIFCIANLLFAFKSLFFAFFAKLLKFCRKFEKWSCKWCKSAVKHKFWLNLDTFL